MLSKFFCFFSFLLSLTYPMSILLVMLLITFFSDINTWTLCFMKDLRFPNQHLLHYFPCSKFFIKFQPVLHLAFIMYWFVESIFSGVHNSVQIISLQNIVSIINWSIPITDLINQNLMDWWLIFNTFSIS